MKKVVLKKGSKPGVKKKKKVAIRRSSRIRKPVNRLGMVDYTKRKKK